MTTDQLRPRHWYFVRRDDGSLAPYQFHGVRHDPRRGQVVAQFFVGSLLQEWPLSRVVAAAQMPLPAEQP
jgi:hypothetical protein